MSGSFAALAEIGPQKERLFAQLKARKIGPERLGRISAQLSRNQSLLTAAMAGLQEAMARLAVLRRADDGFDTYDSQGQRAKVNTARPGFERKA